MKKICCLLLAVLFVLPLSLHAQNLRVLVPSPKTKLEKFSARKGVVIICNFEKIGSIDGLYNTGIEVESQEFIDVSTGEKEYGIIIDVRGVKGLSRSYIDYDEIESLISGIDYMTKADKARINAIYKADGTSSGDKMPTNTIYNANETFSILTYSEEHIRVLVCSKHEEADYNISSLAEIKTLIEKAKAKIDNLKQAH